MRSPSTRRAASTPRGPPIATLLSIPLSFFLSLSLSIFLSLCFVLESSQCPGCTLLVPYSCPSGDPHPSNPLLLPTTTKHPTQYHIQRHHCSHVYCTIFCFFLTRSVILSLALHALVFIVLVLDALKSGWKWEFFGEENIKDYFRLLLCELKIVIVEGLY